MDSNSEEPWFAPISFVGWILQKTWDLFDGENMTWEREAESPPPEASDNNLSTESRVVLRWVDLYRLI